MVTSPFVSFGGAVQRGEAEAFLLPAGSRRAPLVRPICGEADFMTANRSKTDRIRRSWSKKWKTETGWLDFSFQRPVSRAVRCVDFGAVVSLVR